MAWTCFQLVLTKEPLKKIGYKVTVAVSFLAFYLFGNISSYSIESTTTNEAIGINLTWIKDWSSELVFNDHFKRARAWININSKSPLIIDQHGWIKELAPNQSAQTYIFTGFRNHFPAQEFTVLFDGNGKIQFPEASVTQKKNGLYRIRLKENANHLSLIIRKTDPKNYIRNIHIYSGHTIPTTTFRPDFLERWQPFSAIRFKDWMETDNSSQGKWDDRPLPDDFTQASRKGVALEYMIELANTLNISPWFCMPHQANKGYIRKFATMVKAKLKPNLKVYIEYSNEVWNSLFQQYHYAKLKGQQLGLSNQEYLQPIRFYSQRSVETFRIWKSIFHYDNRLVRVLSGQAVAPYMTKEILAWHGAWKDTDAYAIGDYFGHSVNKKLLKQKSPNARALFNLLRRDLNEKSLIIQKQFKIIAAKKLSMIAYEGGQHLVAKKHVELNALYDRANRSQQMRDLYKTHLENWFISGGGLFLHHSSVVRSTKYGRWGLLEWYDQSPLHTKYSVLREIQTRKAHTP